MYDENNWKYIPTEFTYNGKRDSVTVIRYDFFDVVINKNIL